MNVIPTELNKQLAAIVRYSIAANGVSIFGKSAFWFFVGVGFLLFGLGAGTGAAFYGYASITKNMVHLDETASAISKAISALTLRATAEGTIQIEPRELSLAKDQTVTLGSKNVLHLDPLAKVRADGDIVIQGPSISSSPSVGSERTSAPEITNFTVFKHVTFEKGKVVTGWTFLTSAQRSPTDQYCYYSEASEDTPGRNITIDIAESEKIEAPKTLPPSFDLTAAFGRCVWFRGESQ
jgi:hypothetical protein